MHIRPFWIHLKIRTGSIHTWKRDSGFENFNTVFYLDSDQFSTVIGLTHNLTGEQEIY